MADEINLVGVSKSSFELNMDLFVSSYLYRAKSQRPVAPSDGTVLGQCYQVLTCRGGR